MKLNFARLIAFSAIAVVLQVMPGLAASCLENREFYQSLPAVIGKDDQTGKYPFVLNCDTVFVRKGVTTTINPGTFLYFNKPSINSVIKVEGTLIIRGTKNSYVSLSGSLDTAKGKMEPGNKLWGGIEVAEGGRLSMEFAGILHAPTPITTFSRDVKIVNCFFKGSSGAILPDGSLYPMETKWQTINNLDLTRGNVDHKGEITDKPPEALSEKEKNEVLGKKDTTFWTWKRAAGGAAIVAALGVGVIYFLPENTTSPTAIIKPDPEPKTVTNPIDPLPKPPGEP